LENDRFGVTLMDAKGPGPAEVNSDGRNDQRLGLRLFGGVAA